ncbi:uncharacterized protein LOC111345608 [Stylophora pistillata]|uniref:uncharacterized protein LOC111345608 n=1 Tax=Stylophora pistillata TaxID=50429 RepID=UPI000C04F810|nr:uncharacterized protein LOC111345608 [Stylophora pistillata]
MDQNHMECLRIENKKLRGKHNELESDLIEEKEMVKYLHGVIKNYQQLLKSPETTRHLKTASQKSVRRSSSARRVTSEKDVEESFLKNLIEMGSLHSGKEVKPKEQGFVPNDNSQSMVLDTSDCEDTDRINDNSHVTDETLFAIDQQRKKSESIAPTDSLSSNFLGQKARKPRGNTISDFRTLPLGNPSAKCLKREHIIQEMTQMLDSMMQKTTLLEKGLKQKDKHLTKMERRFEYLESIALGEESECL